MNKKTIKVYDTITGKIVDVEVTENLYNVYMRTEWGIKNNDNSFFEHEIQFSQLIGGKDVAFENFHEFITDGDSKAHSPMTNSAIYDLRTTLSKLKSSDKELIYLIYYCGYTEQECTEILGTTQQNLSKKKNRILNNIHKLLKN